MSKTRKENETHGEHKDRVCEPTEIAKCITFENAHHIVHHLVNTNPEAAKAVKNELEYWNDKLGSL